MYEDKTTSFLKGVVLGAVAGAVAGLLLAPQSGEQTRKDIKKFAVDMGDKATDYYKKATKEIRIKIQQLKEAGEKIDEGKYKMLVEEVLAEVKKDGQVTADVAKRMGEQLRSDWGMVKETLASK